MTLPSHPNVWTGDPTPDQLRAFSRGVMGETFPLSQANGARTLPTQVVLGALVPVYGGDVISGLAFCIQTAAAGTAPVGIYLALYDLLGVRLAVSANAASDAKFTSTGVKSIAFATAYTVPAGSTGSLYAAILKDGTFSVTEPQIAAMTAVVGTGQALGSNAKPAVTQAAQATMPAPATFAAVDSYPYLAAV